MKKLIIAVFLFSGFTIQAHATDFNYTGAQGEGINDGWSPGGFPFVGGPAGNNIFGIAQQFTVAEETHLSDLNVDASVLPGFPGSLPVTFGLYTGTRNTVSGEPSPPYPDITTLAFTSNPFTYTETTQQSNADITQDIKSQIPFNVDLQPGTYWLSEEARQSGPEVQFNSITYDAANVSPAVAPEPCTIWLMLFGLAPLLFKRKLLSIFP